MEQQEFCQDCHQKHDCQEVYRRLGNSENPPVFLKVVVAFLLPMVVFIVSLAIFEKVLAWAGADSLRSSQGLQTAVSFFMAMFTTIVFIFVVKLLEKLIRNFT